MHTGKLREDKLHQLECAVSKQENFTYQHKKESEDAVLTSYALSEMITKSSHPFIKEVFIKAADVLCPEKKLLKALVLQQILLFVVWIVV